MALDSGLSLIASPGSLFGETGFGHWIAQRVLQSQRNVQLSSIESHDSFADSRQNANDTARDAIEIAAARTGDGNAYRQLVVRYQPVIAAQMRRFSRDPLVCEELVHEVFVSAYLSLTSYRGDAPWLHWLRKIAVRVGYRYWTERQSNRRESQLAPEEWDQLQGTQAAPSDPREAAELVAKLLDQLPAADRLVLTLIHLDGCSMAEAASRAGWTVTGTKLRAFRARIKLRKILERPGT